jgi:hypothetical protein
MDSTWIRLRAFFNNFSEGLKFTWCGVKWWRQCYFGKLAHTGFILQHIPVHMPSKGWLTVLEYTVTVHSRCPLDTNHSNNPGVWTGSGKAKTSYNLVSTHRNLVSEGLNPRHVLPLFLPCSSDFPQQDEYERDGTQQTNVTGSQHYNLHESANGLVKTIWTPLWWFYSPNCRFSSKNYHVITFIKYLEASDGSKPTLSSGKASMSKMLLTLQLPKINLFPM